MLVKGFSEGGWDGGFLGGGVKDWMEVYQNQKSFLRSRKTTTTTTTCKLLNASLLEMELLERPLFSFVTPPKLSHKNISPQFLITMLPTVWLMVNYSALACGTQPDKKIMTVSAPSLTPPLMFLLSVSLFFLFLLSIM